LGEILVRGAIRFASKPQLPPGVQAIVQLRETSVADAPSRLVAEQVLKDITSRANAGELIPFEISGEPPDQRQSFSIEVLVDVDSDGKPSPGDFINVQSYPVLSFGYPNTVTVEVKEIS
jgi:uncharacterized lipoprotein YbaY